VPQLEPLGDEPQERTSYGAYPTDPARYPEKLLRDVAELYYVKRLSHEAIGQKLNITPRTKVAAICYAAQRAGIVHFAIMPSSKRDDERLRMLASRVRERFKLKACVLVHGRIQMKDAPLETSVREVIIDNIAREAARHLEERFSEMSSPVIAVPGGVISRRITDYLQPQGNTNSEGVVVAAHGMRSLRQDRFDANILARDIAGHFGCEDYYCLPIPAPLDAATDEVVEKLNFVQQVMAVLLHRTNIVIGTLASRFQQGSHKDHYSQPTSLFTPQEVEEMGNKGAMATFGGWWWDKNGEPMETKRRVIGLGLERMKELVSQGQPVILAVGGDVTRLPGLAVALQCKRPLANIWIGDEISARILLGLEEVKDVGFNPAEWTILKNLGR
jgi:DNA-binding transcriptional regulator LsrR (DeoR family)